MPDEVLALDLGGTNIHGARVDREGLIIARARAPSEAARGGEQVLSNIIELAKALKTSASQAVGVVSPGIIDPEEGICRSEAFNIPGWRDMELGYRLARSLSLPVVVENDANAACLGEAWLGAGRGEKIVLILTLGTGIGGGVVMDNQVYHGVANSVAEFGHMTVELQGRECLCGNRGCIEAYASAAAVARRAQELIARDPTSRMLELAGGKREGVDAKVVCDAARAGDDLARRVIGEAAEYLAAAIGNLLNAFNPSAVVLGGGMSLAGEVLLAEVRKRLAAGRALEWPLKGAKLVAAELGDEAGIIGAAKLAWDALSGKGRK